LAVSEFDSPFPRFDILPGKGVVILWLQGFGVVSIIKLNPYLTRIGDLVIHSLIHECSQGFKSSWRHEME
jgi:hypothetical protein